jgi:hypothetical protein
MEWSVMQGREYRGTSFELSRRNNGPHVASEKAHARYLERARELKGGK